jgi:arginyl-tRNA synthetase
VHYDVWFKESELHKNLEVKKMIKRLVDMGYTYEKDGATWLRSTAVGAEQDEVLVRSNGIPTYLAPDIAYHKNKLVDRNFDVAINIWGADHHGYVPRLQSAMKMIGIDENRLKILLFQFVRLISDGEIVKMSKRTGKSVTLSDLLDEINVNCARFFFMMRQTGSHMDFDMDLAKREDNNNPVYYVQYAHARICGILRMMKLNGFDVPKFSEINPNLLIEPEEIDCLKKLCTLPNEIKSAAEQLDPSRITKYLMDLAALFHAFYAACRVKVDDRALCLTRIKLVDAVRIVMETLLDLLKIDAPERM